MKPAREESQEISPDELIPEKGLDQTAVSLECHDKNEKKVW